MSSPSLQSQDHARSNVFSIKYRVPLIFSYTSAPIMAICSSLAILKNSSASFILRRIILGSKFFVYGMPFAIKKSCNGLFIFNSLWVKEVMINSVILIFYVFKGPFFPIVATFQRKFEIILSIPTNYISEFTIFGSISINACRE